MGLAVGAVASPQRRGNRKTKKGLPRNDRQNAGVSKTPAKEPVLDLKEEDFKRCKGCKCAGNLENFRVFLAQFCTSANDGVGGFVFGRQAKACNGKKPPVLTVGTRTGF